MGFLSGPILFSGDTLVVGAGSAVGDALVMYGGVEIVEAGAADINAEVMFGGWQVIESGGWSTGATVVAGGVQTDFGISTGTTLMGWQDEKATQIVGNGGFADSTSIYDGGWQDLKSGGSANGTVVYDGGVQSVENSAVSWFTQVNEHGLEAVDSGGNAWYTTVDGNDAFHTAEFAVWGTANGATINAWGREDVYGTDNNATITNAGQQIVYNGGTANNAHIESGGAQHVGGLAYNTTIGTGGVEDIQAGGTAHGVIFGGQNARLELDSADELTGVVAGFQTTDQIDLRNMQFGAGTMVSFSENGANTSGVLTVTDGMTTAQITLIGQYSAGDFQLSNDSHGGTAITDVQSHAGVLGGYHGSLAVAQH